MKREEIFRRIEAERDRQDLLHPLPNMKPKTSEEAETVKNYFLIQDMLAVLIEEVGEVGSALQGEGDLKEELVHVASCCVRWMENMN
jgi:hypothetical protein